MPWPSYQTKLDSTLQRFSIQHCSIVWPPMLDNVRPRFFARSSVGWSLLLIKNCDQQFCSTQHCCSVLPLFQQSCILNLGRFPFKKSPDEIFGIFAGRMERIPTISHNSVLVLLGIRIFCNCSVPKQSEE